MSYSKERVKYAGILAGTSISGIIERLYVRGKQLNSSTNLNGANPEESGQAATASWQYQPMAQKNYLQNCYP